MERENKENWKEFFDGLWENISDIVVLYVGLVFIMSSGINLIFKSLGCLMLIIAFLLKYWFKIGEEI